MCRTWIRLLSIKSHRLVRDSQYPIDIVNDTVGGGHVVLLYSCLYAPAYHVVGDVVLGPLAAHEV